MKNLQQAHLTESFDAAHATPESNSRYQDFLDTYFPLKEGSHQDVAQYRIYFNRLIAHLRSGRCVGLADPNRFIEFGGDRECPSLISLASPSHQIELHFA
jgi:malate synthase